jgi:hypothetical protein
MAIIMRSRNSNDLDVCVLTRNLTLMASPLTSTVTRPRSTCSTLEFKDSNIALKYWLLTVLIGWYVATSHLNKFGKMSWKECSTITTGGLHASLLLWQFGGVRSRTLCYASSPNAL